MFFIASKLVESALFPSNLVGFLAVLGLVALILRRRFRATDFPIAPYPVDFRTRPADLDRPTKSIADGLTIADIAAHEWLALISYRLIGRTQSIFPGV